MRQIFTRVQLVILWLSGVIISLTLFNFSWKEHTETIQLTEYEQHLLNIDMPFRYRYFYSLDDWFQGIIIPTIIITTLLIVTLIPRDKS